MKYFYELRMLLTYFVFLVPSFLPAGGHLPVSSSGIPYKWDNTNAIPRDIDGGNFGTLIGSAAVIFTETAIDVWAGQSTLTLSFNTTSTAALSADGDVNTVAEYNAISGVIDGRSPIVFDEDGSAYSRLGFPARCHWVRLD